MTSCDYCWLFNDDHCYTTEKCKVLVVALLLDLHALVPLHLCFTTRDDGTNAFTLPLCDDLNWKSLVLPHRAFSIHFSLVWLRLLHPSGCYNIWSSTVLFIMWQCWLCSFGCTGYTFYIPGVTRDRVNAPVTEYAKSPRFKGKNGD